MKEYTIKRTSYSYATVEAPNKKKAQEIAENEDLDFTLDGSDFDVIEMKEYTVVYKFDDVVDNIRAESKEKAKVMAEEMLQSDYNPQNDTVCHKIDIEEVKQ